MPRPFSSNLWRNGAFVRVWTAASVSIFGSFISRLAIPFVAILVLGAGPLEVAALRSLDLVAALAVGLVAGAWVDRLRRRPVLIWTDAARAALLLTIPLAFVLGVLSLWQLFAVSALTALLTTFFDAADNAYLPSIVRTEQLVEANAALTASASTAEVTAFGISGFLIQLLSAPIAVAIDALSFIGSALLLGSIRQREDRPEPSTRRPILGEIREGAGLVGRDPVLRALLLTQMSQAVLWGVFGATYLLFAFEELQLGPAAIGLVTGAGGAGSLLGALVVGPAIRRWGIGPTAVVAMLCAAAGNALVPLAPAGAPLVAAAFLVGQQVIGDGGVTAYDITEQSVRQATVDNRLLGRASSTFHAASGAAQLVGTIGAGLVAEAYGLRAAALLAPAGALIGAAVLWGSPVRSLQIAALDAGGVPGYEPDTIGEEPVGG